MAQAVSRRPLSAEVQVRSQNNPRGICGGQSDGRTGFCPSTSISPGSMMLHTLSLTHYHKCHIILENDSVNKQHSRHGVGSFLYWDGSANQQFYNLSAFAKSLRYPSLASNSLWGPSSLQFNAYRRLFHRRRQAGHSHSSNAEVRIYGSVPPLLPVHVWREA